ncbi:MAG: hypothetical protein K0Q79_1505 [Flavipsychrobacter sp.]|jgi:hypothetical protein|nr:hypothetical protein [Flavipsychrobacter sp.]
MITKNIRQYFESHKDVNELFFTNDHLEDNGGDQLAFFREDTANTHARNLKDKTVTRITREEAFADTIVPIEVPAVAPPDTIMLQRKARSKTERIKY